MAGADVSAIRAGLGANLASVSGLRVHTFPPDSINPPAAVVAYPDIDYDATYGRGSDRLVIPVHVVVGKVSERAANARLDTYLSTGGIKSAIESDVTLDSAVDTVRVMSAESNVMTIAGQDYLAATFQVEILT